jgi:CDP-paratose 2-epimerase
MARFLDAQGMTVVGIDNDLRSYFFGPEASTRWNAELLMGELRDYRHEAVDVRDRDAIERIFRRYGGEIALIVHCAAQPSHDWAAREPLTDFEVNATGTLILLEAARAACADAVFIFLSTNKVYGDAPNELPLVETATRWEVDPAHRYAEHGIDEGMRVDRTKHSLFGASKLAADVLTQEYGRYFGMRTGAFRGGCLTGPAHSGAELHGFLAYLVSCVVSGRPYTIYGYKGKQVRDNIHSHDLVRALWRFAQRPTPGAVYNIGGSRHANCSVLEAIEMAQEIAGRELAYTLDETARSGDHIWWISDVRAFQADHPEWSYRYDLRETMVELVEAASERTRVRSPR